ncbi:hypothetical protein GGR42_000479 [Saonia flava]|uniref:Uncharacterized protein n=1 Tax=Saonia flava TaxID=523696 RepID=A0A846QS39_9FLAO|nr:hypothetical protein [Saonia flava]
MPFRVSEATRNLFNNIMDSAHGFTLTILNLGVISRE